MLKLCCFVTDELLPSLMKGFFFESRWVVGGMLPAKSLSCRLLGWVVMMSLTSNSYCSFCLDMFS